MLNPRTTPEPGPNELGNLRRIGRGRATLPWTAHSHTGQVDRVGYVRAVLELGHAAADGLPVLGEALEVLDRYVGGDVLNVARVDAVHGSQGELAIRGGPPLTDAEQAEWMRLIPTHPYARWLTIAPVLTSRLTDVVSIAALERTEVFQTLLRPRGHRYQSALLLDRRPDAMTMISLWREDSDFADRELEALEMARQVIVTGLEHAGALERAQAWAGGVHAPLLTPRQREVAGLIAQGLTNDQIGRRLQISTRTVRKHVEDVFAATGCHNRTAVALWWHQGGRRAT